MVVYLFISSFIFMGVFIPKKYSKYYFRVSYILLFIFTAFRNINIGGTDAMNYQNFFYNIVPRFNNLSQYNYDYEYGYMFVNSILKSIFNNYLFYQVIYTFITLYLLKKVILALNYDHIEMSLFLFVYFTYQYLWNNFVLLRQNIALLLFWLALLYLYDKRLKGYILIGISSLFHRSSILNLIFFEILRVMEKIKKEKRLFIAVLLSTIFFIFSEEIFLNMTNVLSSILGERISRYSGSSDYGNINYINYVLKWIFVLLFYLGYDIINNNKKALLLNTSLIAVILSSINIEIFDRFAEYFVFSIYLLIPLTVKMFRNEDRLFYKSILFVIFTTILIRFLYTFDGGSLIGYFK
jgi:hypothetical protein